MLPNEKANAFPVSIVSCDERIATPELLLKERPLQIGFSTKNIWHLTYGTVVLDFGSLSFGGIRFLIRDTPKDGRIRIHLMKSLDEQAVKFSPSVIFTVPTTIYSDMTYANTEFRYAKIDFLKASGSYGVAAIVRRNYDENRLDPIIAEK